MMRDGLWNGSAQKMVLLDGTPKGMKKVLQKCGIDVKGMNAEKMRELLNILTLKPKKITWWRVIIIWIWSCQEASQTVC